MCVNRLSVVPVRISVNSRLVVDEFGGRQKFDADFLLCVAGGEGALAPLTPTLFKSKLHLKATHAACTSKSTENEK